MTTAAAHHSGDDGPYDHPARLEDCGVDAKTGSDRRQRLFVGLVWLSMLLVALGCVVRYGRNAPLSEDWTAVPALTGNETSFPMWLWSQNNEHRLPLPRLIHLASLEISGGDFRAGMVLNIVLLAALAAACILVARRLRGGQTTYTDAFFPLLLLHLGNWENLLWSWQLQFVVSVVLITTLVLVLVKREGALSPRASILAGVALALLPFTGASGLVLVPFFAVWLSYEFLIRWRSRPSDGVWHAWFLLGCCVLSVLVCALYFLGYERPTWNPPSGGLLATLKTTTGLLVMGLGPGVRRSWEFSTAFVGAVLLGAAGVTIMAVRRADRTQRHRTFGVLVAFLALGALGLAMGWGRSGLVPTAGLPQRYVLLAAPMLILVYFAWELYGAASLRRWVHAGIMSSLVLLLPLNTSAGFEWRDWYIAGMTSFERDVSAGVPVPVLARDHRDFLMHWSEPTLAANLEMLCQDRLGPFDDLAPGDRKSVV